MPGIAEFIGVWLEMAPGAVWWLGTAWVVFMGWATRDKWRTVLVGS